MSGTLVIQPATPELNIQSQTAALELQPQTAALVIQPSRPAFDIQPLTPSLTISGLGQQGPAGFGIVHGSYAAMVAATPPSDGKPVMLGGYYQFGDAGNGTFLYSASSTLPDNGGTVIAPESGVGRYLRQYSGRRDVRWFGARQVTDGTDGPFIQACWNAGDGEVWMPPGDWYTNIPLTHPSGVNIWFAGEKHSRILPSTDFAGTISDTSVPGQTVNVSTLIWQSGSVTEITGFQGVREGENVIVIGDTTGLVKGDALVFVNERPYSLSTSRHDYRDGFFNTIHNIRSGTDIRLTHPAPTTLDPADDIHVYKVTPCTGTINDVTIVARPGYSAYHMKWGYDCTHFRVNATGSDTQTIYIDRCYEVNVTTGQVRDESNITYGAGQTGGTNYGLMLANCENCKGLGGYYESGRHGVVTGGDSSKIAVPCRHPEFHDITCRAQRGVSWTSNATVSTVISGALGANEVQRIDARTATTGTSAGAYIFSFNGRSTEPVSYNASAATLQAALEVLPTIGAGNVSLSGGPLNSSTIDVTYQNALGAQNVTPLIITAAVGITTITPGVLGVSEIQHVDVSGVGGSAATFHLTWLGQTTREIGGDATAPYVRVALEALSTVGTGNVTVVGLGAGDTGPFDVYAKGALANQSLALLTGSAGVTVSRTQAGAAGTNAMQRIDARAIGAANIFELLAAGQFTGTLLGNATAADIQAALELLPNIGTGNVTVAVTSGDVGTTADQVRFDVTLAGTLGSRAFPRIEGGVALIQTPYSADLHGNVIGARFVGCRFLGGVSLAGDNTELINCSGTGNMESGSAILLGEMLGPNHVIDGGIWEAVTNFGTSQGLIHITMPNSCVNTGTLTLRNLTLKMGKCRDAFGAFHPAIDINHDGFDPFGPHPPFTPVAQQWMDLVIDNVTVMSELGNLNQDLQAYALWIWSSASVAQKGFRNIWISKLRCTGIGGLYLFNNDPEYLDIDDMQVRDAPDYGLRIMANYGASHYPNGYWRVRNSSIIGSRNACAYIVGSQDGTGTVTTPVDKRLELTNNTFLNGAKNGAGIDALKSSIWCGGFVDVKSEGNTWGDIQSVPTQTRLDAYDYITNLVERNNYYVGTITTEFRGAHLTSRYVERRRAGIPTDTAATGSVHHRTDGTAGNTFYVREPSAWVPK